jgi:DNA mismatch repair ATPase MutS
MESKRYPMCGFPIAQMDKYLEKLVRECNRFVAICEETKHYDKQGNMRNITRKVVRVVTPGKFASRAYFVCDEVNISIQARSLTRLSSKSRITIIS